MVEVTGMPGRVGAKTEDIAYPRVLVATNVPFSWHTSNGKTMSSLFRGWPKDRLAQVYVPFATPAPPMFDVCENYWALTPLGLRRVARESEARSPGGSVRSVVASFRSWVATRAYDPRLMKAGYPVRELIYTNPALWRGRNMRALERFAPEALFTMVSSLSGVRMVNRLAKYFGVPSVPLITDDWISTEYSSTYFSRTLRRELQAAFEEFLSLAPTRLVISDAMADEYRRRYGGAFEPFTQAVDADQFDPRPRVGGALERTRLVYAGNLGIGRWQCLRAIGDELVALEREGIRAELVVYSNPAHIRSFGAELQREPYVRVAGNVSAEQLRGIYRDADVLVHAESFDPQFTGYTAFSLSTKVSEYLMAGRPLLGLGPARLGALRHMAASGGAAIADSLDPQVIRSALRRLLGDPGLRKALGERGRQFAMKHHEIRAQHGRFLRIVADAVLRRRAGDA